MSTESAATAPAPYSQRGVISSYLKWLEVKSPGHREAFDKRLKEDPEAALAEAVTFSVLQLRRLNPRPGEDPSTGGVDFICEPSSGGPLAVEVTAIRAETVANQSGLPAAGLQNSTGSFAMLTSSLKGAATGKAAQMRGYPMPRLLVIATSHPDASLLMGAQAAVWLLTGTTSFSIRTSEPASTADLITHLYDSAFIRPRPDGKLEPARQSISAILLAAISEACVSLIGVLHPAPAHPFDPRNFDSVHFCRLAAWPVEDTLRVEWVGPAPSVTPFPLWPVSLGKQDLASL